MDARRPLEPFRLAAFLGLLTIVAADGLAVMLFPFCATFVGTSQPDPATGHVFAFGARNGLKTFTQLWIGELYDGLLVSFVVALALLCLLLRQSRRSRNT
jgi:hypothetical protein